MFYEFTRKELKGKNGTDFKQGDIICIGNFQIEIDYGKEKFKRPSLCSKVFDIKKRNIRMLFLDRSIYLSFCIDSRSPPAIEGRREEI